MSFEILLLEYTYAPNWGTVLNYNDRPFETSHELIKLNFFMLPANLPSELVWHQK